MLLPQPPGNLERSAARGRGTLTRALGALAALAAGAVLALPAAAQTTSTVSIDESPGKTTTGNASGKVLATITAASTDNPIAWSITDGAGTTFAVNAVSNEGVVSLAEATNFNFEKKASHTITLQSSDNSSVTEDFVLVVNINNVVEHPADYQNVNLQSSPLAHNAITISWSNQDFIDEFESFDQGPIVLSLVSSSQNFILATVAVTTTVWSGIPTYLRSGNRTSFSWNNRVTANVRFFSKDGSAGQSRKQASGYRMLDNNAPVFAGPAAVEVAEASGADTPTSTGLVTLAATDADPFDVVAYSIRNTLSSDDGRFFGVDSSTGVITLKAAKQLLTQAKQRYTLNVRASDSATPFIRSSAVRSSDRSIVIRATAPPIFANAPDPFPVTEYLGDGGVAPVGYEIGAVTLTSGIANADDWELVHAPSGFAIDGGTRAATLSLAATLLLDFEHTTYSSNKNFATLTIRALAADDSTIGQQVVMFAVANAAITSAAVKAGWPTVHTRFVGGSSISRLPTLVLNGVDNSESVRGNINLVGGDSSVPAGQYLNTAPGVVNIRSVAPAGAINFTLILTSTEGVISNLRQVSSAKVIAKPVLDSATRQSNGDWHFVFSAVECTASDVYFGLEVGSSAIGYIPCDAITALSSFVLGGVTMSLANSGAGSNQAVTLVMGGYSSGRVQVKAMIAECYVANVPIDTCIADTAGNRAVHYEPLTFQFISPKLVEVPEYLGDGSVAPVGHALAVIETARPADSFSLPANTTFGLNSSAVLNDTSANSRSATLVLKTTLNLDYEHADRDSAAERLLVTLTIGAINAEDTDEALTHPITLSLVNAAVTSAVVDGVFLDTFVRYAGSASQIDYPALLLNGQSNTESVTGAIANVAGPGAAGLSAGSTGVQIAEDTAVGQTNFTLSISSTEGGPTVVLSRSVRIVERPVLEDIFEDPDNAGTWVFVYSGVVCDDMRLRVNFPEIGTGKRFDCGDFRTVAFELSPTGPNLSGTYPPEAGYSAPATVSIIVSALPSGSDLNMQIRISTDECHSYTSVAIAACENDVTAARDNIQNFPLPLKGLLKFDGRSTSAPTVIEVDEWLGSTGVAPAGHYMHNERLAATAQSVTITSASLVGSSDTYGLDLLPIGFGNIRITLKTTLNLDYEAAAYATNKNLATLTIRAEGPKARGLITVILRLTDAETIVARLEKLSPPIIRFKPTSNEISANQNIPFPNILLNDYIINPSGGAGTDIISLSGDNGRILDSNDQPVIINTQGSDFIFTHIHAARVRVGDSTTLTTTFDFVENNAPDLVVTTTVRIVPRPRVTSSRPADSSRWWIRVADIDCANMGYQIISPDVNNFGVCSNDVNSNTALLPSFTRSQFTSGQMTLRFFTNECLSDFYNAAEKTACREDTTNRSVEFVFDLPLGSTPFIVGGAQQVIEVPEITFRDSLPGKPGIAPPGWVVATLRLASGFTSDTVSAGWGIASGGNSADYLVQAIPSDLRRDAVHLVVRPNAELNLAYSNYTNGILGRIRVIAYDRDDISNIFTSNITLSLVQNPEVTVQVNDFRNVNQSNLVEIVPNIERTFTVPPAVSSAAPDTKLTNGEYRAVLAPNNSMLPIWLGFDKAALQFTVAVEAGRTPGDYPIRMLYIDEESDMKLVDYQFTLRILQPLRFENVVRFNNRRFYGLFTAGGQFTGDTDDESGYGIGGSANTQTFDLTCSPASQDGVFAWTGVGGSPAGFHNMRLDSDCDTANNRVTLEFRTNGGAALYNSNVAITLSLAAEIAGVRQTVVQVVNTDAASAEGVNGEGSAIGGDDPIVVTGYGSGPQLLREGHVIPIGTDLLTLTLNWENAPSALSTEWFTHVHPDNPLLSKVWVRSSGTDRLATLQVQLGRGPLTLDYETMSDANIAIRTEVSGSGVANPFTRYKRVIMRVANVNDPHTIGPLTSKGFLAGTAHSFTVRAEDPEAFYYRQLENYTYSLTNLGGGAVPGWLSVGDDGLMRIAASATDAFLTLRISATSDASPPVTAMTSITVLVAEPIRIASIGGDSISTTLFLEVGENTCGIGIFDINGSVPDTGGDGCYSDRSGTIDSIDFNYDLRASTANKYFAIANGALSKLTVSFTSSHGENGGDVRIDHSTDQLIIDIPYADPNPFSFVNAANPQFVSIPAAAGATATSNSNPARSFAAGLALATVGVRNIGAGNMVDWSATNTNPAAAAGALGVISSSDREAVIGFASQALIANSAYPVTMTIAAAAGGGMIEKELIFTRAVMTPEALVDVLVTVDVGSSSTFTRHPAAKPPGTGITYQAMLVDGNDRLQPLPVWLGLAAASGQFTVQHWRAAAYGLHKVRVFAVEDGARTAAGDFQLYTGRRTRFLSREIVTREGTDYTDFLFDMGVQFTGVSIAEATLLGSTTPAACGNTLADLGSVGDIGCQLLAAPNGQLRRVLVSIAPSSHQVGAFKLTLAATGAAAGGPFSWEFNFNIQDVAGTRLVSVNPVYGADQRALDITVEYPANAMPAANAPLATVEVGGVNALSGSGVEIVNCCSGTPLQYTTERNSVSGLVTVVVAKNNTAGALFPSGVDEYRLIVRAYNNDLGEQRSVYSNLIIRKAELPAVTAPGLNIRNQRRFADEIWSSRGATQRFLFDVPHGQGKTLPLSRFLSNPSNLPISWQLLVEDGDDADSLPDAPPAGMRLDGERLVLHVAPNTPAANYPLIIRGTYSAGPGLAMSQIEGRVTLRRLGVPLQVTRVLRTNSGNDVKLWISSLRGCKGDLFGDIRYDIYSGGEFTTLTSDASCTAPVVGSLYRPFLEMDFSDIDNPNFTLKKHIPFSSDFSRQSVVFAPLEVLFAAPAAAGSSARDQTRQIPLNYRFNPADYAVGSTVTVAAVTPTTIDPITVRISEIVGTSSEAAVAAGTAIATVTVPVDFGYTRADSFAFEDRLPAIWRLAGPAALTGLLRLTRLETGLVGDRSEPEAALISWTQAVTLNHEDPQPSAIADFMVTLILEGPYGDTVATPLRIILDNVDESTDNALPVYTGLPAFVRGIGSKLDSDDAARLASANDYTGDPLVVSVSFSDSDGFSALAVTGPAQLALTSTPVLADGALLIAVDHAADGDDDDLVGFFPLTLSATDTRGGVTSQVVTLVYSLRDSDDIPETDSLVNGVFTYSVDLDVCGAMQFFFAPADRADFVVYDLPVAECTLTGNNDATDALVKQTTGFRRRAAFINSNNWDPNPQVTFTDGTMQVVAARFPAGEVGGYIFQYASGLVIGGRETQFHSVRGKTENTTFTQSPAITEDIGNNNIIPAFSIDEDNTTLPAGTRLTTFTLSEAFAGTDDISWEIANQNIPLMRVTIAADPDNPRSKAILSIAPGSSLINNLEHHYPTSSSSAQPVIGGNYVIRVTRGSGLGQTSRTFTSGIPFFLTNVTDKPVLPAIGDRGPYGASGDTTERSFQIDALTTEDNFTSDSHRSFHYHAQLKNGTGLPAGVSFDSATRTFAIAAGSRAAGAHVISVTPTISVGLLAFRIPETLAGDAVDFTLSIVEYLPGMTTTVSIDEAGGHNATVSGAVSLGVVELAAPLSGVAWSLRGTSTSLAVRASTTNPNDEAVIQTAGTSSDSHPFDYEALTNGLFARITLVATAGEVVYAQVVDVVLNDLDEDLALAAIDAKSASAGASATSEVLPAATNAAGVDLAVTYKATKPDDSLFTNSDWITFDPATRALAIDASTQTAGTSQMVKYTATETGNSSNTVSRTFNVLVVSPNTGDITWTTTNLSPLTRVAGDPGASTVATVSVHLSQQPDANNVTLTITNASGKISFIPDSVIFTRANYSTPQPVTLSVLMLTSFDSAAQQLQLTAAVHDQSSSDINYRFTTASSFAVTRSFINQLPVQDTTASRLLVVEKPASGNIVLTPLSATDPDGDTLAFASARATSSDPDLFASATKAAFNSATGQLTLFATVDPGVYPIRVQVGETHGQSTIPYAAAVNLFTVVIGEASFDTSDGHAIAADAASFTFDYAICDKMIIDVGYGSEKTRYEVPATACTGTPSATGTDATELGTQPSATGFVNTFTASPAYDPAPNVNFATAGEAIVRLNAFALDAASQAYSVSVAFVRPVAGSDVAHSRATSPVQDAYLNYSTPVYARTNAVERIAERNTVSPGDVLLTITLSTPAPFPHWVGTGGDGGAVIEVVASPTNPQTEGLVRVAAGQNLDFDHESLSDGEVSVQVAAVATNGSGAAAKVALRRFHLVADPRNDETPVLPQPDDQGPYPVAGGSEETFVISAATDADRGSGGDIAGYRASLIVSGSAEALPSWITFTSATRTFAVAAAGRSAGTHVIEVEAYDNGTNPGVLTARRRFDLVVITSGQPYFVGSDRNFNIDENSPAGTAVGTATATDDDDTDSTDAWPAYALSSAADGLFVIDAASGVISTAPGSSFDHESGTTSYTFKVTATDAGGQVGETDIVVTIDDVDEAPEFASSSQSFEVIENGSGEQTAAGTVIATVTATDEDVGAVIAYSLTGTDAGVFAIDAATGVISLAAAEAFVFGRDYSFNVVATSAGKSDTLVVAVNVVGGTPNFTATTYNFSLPENSPAATEVGTVRAIDGNDTDDADAWPAYALSAAADGLFVIDAATGVITALQAAGDFEAGAASWRFKVTALDEEGNTGEADVVVTVTDVDEPPQFAAAQITVEVTENEPGESTAAGTAIATIIATDPDAGSAVVAYRLAGADAGVFEIDAASGVISPAAEIVFSLASKDRYELVVLASSGGLSSRAEVIIEVGIGVVTQAAQDMAVFSSVDRAIAVAAIDIIGARFEAPGGVGGLPPVAGDGALLSAAEQLSRSRSLIGAKDMWAQWEYDEGIIEDQRGISSVERMRLREFVYDRGFDLALGPPRRGPQARMWGSGSRVVLNGTPTVAQRQFSYEGEVDVLMFGLEARAAKSGPRLGLAYSTSEGEFDLDRGGKVKRSLQSLHPYLSIDAGADSNLWLAMGFGRGEYERDDESRDASALSAAAGARKNWELHGYKLGFSGQLVSGRSILERSAVFEEMEVNAWRAELELEVGREFSFPDQDLVMSPFVTFDGRSDGGDGDAQKAFDAGGGVRLNWAEGLQLELSGRVQTSSGDHEEKRFEGSFIYDYENDGRGLMMSAKPSFERVENDNGRVSFKRTLVGDLGYGLPINLFVDSGLSKVNVSATTSSSAAAVASYGWSFAGRRLGVDLAAGSSKIKIKFELK